MSLYEIASVDSADKISMFRLWQLDFAHDLYRLASSFQGPNSAEPAAVNLNFETGMFFRIP